MNSMANRQVICDVLCTQAACDRDIIVLCSDSRGSASMTPFFEKFPEQSVETGIAEQNIVSMAAGLASSGKKPFVFSPASFLSSRSYEQIKVDCAYSHSNVKLVGISGGISYGALGLTHHSVNDIAAMTALPGLEVYIPSDRFQTEFLVRNLTSTHEPAYIRIGRNPVEDVYDSDSDFEIGKAIVMNRGNASVDIAIVACGEMVRPAVDAASKLKEEGISSAVIDMYCLKPFDKETLLDVASSARAVITVEEHSPFGGLGALVCQCLSKQCPKPVFGLALPDKPVTAGTSKELFDYYGLNSENIVIQAKGLIQ